jgi:hypothetical protein
LGGIFRSHPFSCVIDKELDKGERTMLAINRKASDAPNFIDSTTTVAVGTAVNNEKQIESPQTEMHLRAAGFEAKSRNAEMLLKSSYVEASLRNQTETAKGTASPFNGLRIGWKDGHEVKITRSLSPAVGHETRMDAVAFARLSGADPTAVVRDSNGKWHAVELDGNFHGGTKLASDNNLRNVEGLTHFDQKNLEAIQQEITQAQQKGDYEEVSRLQKSQAALVFGVDESEINFIKNSNERVAGKININTGKSGGGLHGAEKAPNSNFDPTKKNAMEIGIKELANPKNASAIIFHENSHAKDYALTQHWIGEYEKETGKKFVPGDKGDIGFTTWINSQAPKKLSRADAEVVSDVSANANGSSEAKAYVGTFINAIKAGNPEAAATQLRSYAAGMLSRPQKINRPTGAHVELELKRQLEIEYQKMPKEMKAQFDKTFQEIAKNYPDAWISKFNHATALNVPR